MNIVSDRQMQRLNQIKNAMDSIDSLTNLNGVLSELRLKYVDILDCKNADNSREFIQDIKNRIKAIDLLKNV